MRTTAIDDFDLRHATIEVLDDAPGTGTQRPRLRAATYETTSDTSAATVPDRLAWLDRDPTGYSPLAYDHLAAMYLRAGEPDAAHKVKIASLRRRRHALPMPGRMWNWLLDITVGYGYRPWLAGLWLVLLTVPSAIYFAHLFPADFTGAVDKPAPFQPFIYTLDTLLPVIDFGQSSSWHPTVRPPGSHGH